MDRFKISITVFVICLIIGTIDVHFGDSVEKVLGYDLDSVFFFYASIILPLIPPTVFIALDFKKFNESSEPRFVRIQQDIETIKSLNSPLGTFKKISDTNIWKFEEEIWGWNPNWSLENKSTDKNFKNGLNKIHKDRILDSNITSINYIFLEGYKILEENGDKIDMDFSVDKFCEYLNKIADKKFAKAIKQKYNIWIIPEKDWKKGGDLHQLIKTYRDFIVITGSKEGNLAATFFMNYHWCFNVIGHKYFFELQYHADLVIIFDRFIKDVCGKLKEKGITEKKVIFQNGKFKLGA